MGINAKSVKFILIVIILMALMHVILQNNAFHVLQTNIVRIPSRQGGQVTGFEGSPGIGFGE